MELKNQILLVILIPILLILCLAIFQVGLLGFSSIPAFQTSLLEFHIGRHINGLSIEMKILSQEIFIQNQAYYNQLLGVAAHLRYYSYGDFQQQNQWQFNDLNLADQNFHSGNTQALDPKRTLDWFHPNYTNLKDLQSADNGTYNLLVRAARSLHLGNLLISPLQLSTLSKDSNFTIYSEDETSESVPIDYEFMQIVCTNGMELRLPPYNSSQLALINSQSSYNATSLQNAQLLSLNSGQTLNFTLNVAQADNFSPLTGITLQQIISTDVNGSTCALNVKVLNNYLYNLTDADSYEHQNQSEHQHNLFIALNDQNMSALSPANFSSCSLGQAIFNKFVTQNYAGDAAARLLNSTNDPHVQTINGQLAQLAAYIRNQSLYNLTQSGENADNFFTFNIDGYELYILMNLVDTKSDKTFSELTDPASGITYLHIGPQTNSYSVPTFVVIHSFEKGALIKDLYTDTSLSDIKILEIAIFIVIVVLSIVIFIFVWFTAKRIGQSFEQPIRVLTDFMNSIDIQNMEQEEELMGYEEYFNSFEIRALFKTMNIFVTTIKYSNQKYSNSKHSDAIALMELSKAKDFYKKEIGNMSAVGICANNIGVLHMKGQRVFEAVNEMEEAIFIAKQELQEIKELKKWCFRMIQNYQEPNFYSNFRAKVQGLANKFRQIEINWINKIQKTRSDSKKQNKSPKHNSQHRATFNVTKNLSMSQYNSKTGLPQISLLGNKSTNQPMLSGNQTIFHSVNGTSPYNNYRQNQDFSKYKKDKNDNFGKGQYDIQELISVDQDQMSHQSPSHKPPFAGNNSQINQSSMIQSNRQDMKESILSEIGKRQSSPDAINFKMNQTEMDMLEEKIQELKKKKQSAQAKLQNRQFQLAQFMFNICMHYSDVFIPETLSLFEQFESASNKHQKINQSKMVRMINLYVKKALCYIQIGDIPKFLVEESRAEKMYEKLVSENQLNDGSQQDEQDYNFVDMFKNVPFEVLYSKILQLKAIYALLKGNFKTSAEYLTQIIELGEYYDPEVRDFCLVLLENIFKLFSLPTAPIQLFQSHLAINVYEIVMMIDYSKEMSIEQINLSHTTCTKIFSTIQPQDLIGLYGFNNSLHEAFPLQPKGTYKDLLQKQLFMAITAPGGKSKLYQTLRYAVKNFFEHRIDFQSKIVCGKGQGDITPVQPIVRSPQSSNQKSYISVNPETFLEKIDEMEHKEDDDDLNTEFKDQVKSAYELEESSDSDSEFKLFTSNTNHAQNEESNKSANQNDYRSRYKYICLFTEINKLPTASQQAKLKKLLLDNQVDLLVFNIANQNANMLDLKNLSKITPKSMFVNINPNSNAPLDNIFGKSRQNQLQKKMYLEFF